METRGGGAVSRIFFASDHHFGHQKVAGIREFPTVPHHDLALIDRHNEVVRPDDVVYFLGDLSAGGTMATREALNKVRYMNGRKRLIAGNHDPVHPMNRDAHKWFPEYLEVFESVAPFGRASINGTKVLLSHFPYEVDRDEPRYLQYRLRDEGAILLHGHLHSIEKVTSPREIHVGLDAWDYTPVEVSRIEALFTEQNKEAA
jgi:calcineurin-like phosphoesterase family protein